MGRLGSKLLLSVFAAALVLSGCSTKQNEEPPKPETEKGSSTNAGTNSGGKEGAPDKLPDKYDPGIEVTTVVSTYPTTKYADGDDMNNNPWTRMLEQEYGIKVKTLWGVPDDQYEQKLNLNITSGEIPDFFRATSAQFKQLNEAELLEDMTEIYAKYATDNVRQVIDEAGPEVMKAAAIDGRLMGIPYTGVVKESASMLYVRKDWLKKVNLPEPQTMDDVLKIAEAFATQDPDGNGKADTYGLMADNELGGLDGFLNGYHAYRGIWLKDKENQLVYSSIQPEMKTALGKLQQLYQAGAIDHEFGVKAGGKVNEEIIAGRIGMFYSAMYAPGWPLQQSIDKDPNAEWQAYPMPSADGNPALAPHGLNVHASSYWVVRKGAEHPEAIFRMMDAWLDLQFLNKSDELFKKMITGENGSGWTISPIKMYRSFNNVNNHLALVPYLKGEETDKAKLTPDQRNLLKAVEKYLNGDKTNWSANAIWGIGGTGSVVDNYLKKNQFLADQFFGSPTPAMVDKAEVMKKLEITTFTKIIQGAPLEEFDTFVEQWYKQGGEQITKEVGEWYAQNI
ncbi:extracellular solute-binding protein [Paenibacillus sp. GCM10027626]|uniref:extracellular solute-binding protein n=1 Tax=Paenibacillus sp. GCM10027626 TaxID=3273411 RepID=UPI0036393F45